MPAGMGRLDDIIARNKNPRRHGRASLSIGIGLSLFVLLILVLMIFTDLDESPNTASTPQETSAPPEKGRVRGIQLMVEPARRDAGAGN